MNSDIAVTAGRRAGNVLRSREGAIFAAIIGIGFLLRLYVVISTTYLWDEDREWIPLSQTISWSHLPWRSLSHSALTAYLVKITSAVFGNTPLGFRIGFALAGTLTIWAVGKIAWEWLGFEGAVVAATAMALNEYHLAISATATEKSPSLMLSALAMLHFGRFLGSERTRNLYWAAMFAGFAFLFKETAALLLPVCLAALVASGKAGWLRRREAWIAAAIGAIVVAPDLFWNVRHWDQGYGIHAGRVSGLGLTPHFFLFFGRDLIRDIYRARGIPLFDPGPEYPSMNALWGAILLGTSGLAVLKWRTLPAVGRLAALSVWMVLLFFVLNKTGQPRFVEETGALFDAKLWFWVDLVLIGGSLLIAWFVSNATRPWRDVALVLVAVASLVSTVRLFRNRLGIPDVKIVFAPRAVWPPDGRLVKVEAVVLTCQICEARVRLIDTMVDPNNGKGLVAPSEDDLVGAASGTDDREFTVRAATDPVSRRRDYVFRYAPMVGNSPRAILSPLVSVMKRAPVAPFWAAAPEHRDPR